jgi:hypothetical protein
MVITQNLFRRLKLVLPQVRDFEEDIVIHELAPAARLVLTCEDDHDMRSDAALSSASSGSQFVEPAVYAPQKPGIPPASSTIHVQAASLALLTVIVH